MAGALGAARQRLSSLLTTTQKHAKPVLDATEREVTQRYSRMMETNKQYVVKDQAKAETLLKQWWYTKLARCARSPALLGRLQAAGGRRLLISTTPLVESSGGIMCVVQHAGTRHAPTLADRGMPLHAAGYQTTSHMHRRRWASSSPRSLRARSCT